MATWACCTESAECHIPSGKKGSCMRLQPAGIPLAVCLCPMTAPESVGRRRRPLDGCPAYQVMGERRPSALRQPIPMKWRKTASDVGSRELPEAGRRDEQVLTEVDLTGQVVLEPRLVESGVRLMGRLGVLRLVVGPWSTRLASSKTKLGVRCGGCMRGSSPWESNQGRASH
jgi:hypothetical protein